jgi:pilus assembly protein FimV
MRLNTRSKITSFALKTLSGAVASAVFLSSSAYAAGLGKLTVLSALGQPLVAEIELTAVSADDASGLVAKLAPADAFRTANIDFNPALLNLRFVVEQRGSRQYIKITSSQPVNEPFVDMLLELSWSTGKLVREYTFLLDPTEMRSPQSAQVTAPVDVLQGARAGSATKGSVTRLTPASSAAQPAATRTPAAERAPAAERSASDTQYKVKAGDTLGKIAAQLKPVEVSLDMMLVALYRANPDAFAGNNMNRLKSGQILAVPDSGAIKATGDGEARGVVVAHAADFNAYRNKLAGQVATTAPDKAPAASQSTGGKITAKVEERRTPANESKDQLKLSKATSPTDASGKSAVSAEERIAKEKALADATARVKELERNVSELEKLMVIKNKAAADAQKAAPGAKVAPPVAAVVAPLAKPAAVVPPPAAKPAAVVPAPVPAPVAAKPVPVPVPVVTPAPPVAAPVAAAPAPVVAPVAKPAAKIAVLKKNEPAQEPGILDMLKENLLLVAAALAAIAAIAFMVVKRRAKSESGASNEPSILGAPTDQAHSLFAETGGQSVDTSNSVFNSSFAPSASQLDTNEVDPVAEADVYIAYGRDAQAEEILKEALRTHPERYPVRLKLLEIYAARKDLRSFETQATDLYSLTKGQGDEWTQAAALGLAIDPLNPLYASAANSGPSTVIPVAAEPVVLAKQAVMPDVPTDLDLSDATALPVAPVVAAAAAEEHSLDFDLGGLSFEPAAHAAPVVAPAVVDFGKPAAKADDLSNMDFNMDFDAPAVPAAAHAKADTDLDLHSNDFTAEYAASQKNDLSGMGDLASAFDIPSAPVAAHAPAAPLDLGAMNFDLPASATAPAASAAPQFDMSGIDLDLPAVDTSTDHFANTMVMDSGDQSAVHMEMETKLDLAIAYQEIGAKDGARELLDEVIKGGSGEQVGKANEMRAKLA